MKTIKIIDLLNKIANGEEVPKTLKYDKKLWKYEECYQDYSYIKNGILEKYLLQDIMSGIYSTTNCLNDKAEIIEEEKEIEKLNLDTEEVLKNVVITAQDYVIEGKINELIDIVNELKRGN